MLREITVSDIQEARAVLSPYLVPTPLIRNAWLSEAYGCEVYLKLESMQPIGSFKIRGATVRIARLTPEERARGVLAASAGNHAQGVAWGSRQLGVSALIVMPRNAPLTKLQATRALGAQVVLHGDDFEEAYAHAKEVEARTGRVFIPAFEDADVIAGQGTVGLELLEQLPDLDMVVGSIGGGGMMAGLALLLKERRPDVEIIGCQASGAASMVRSIRKGHAVSLEVVQTFADGIAVARARESMHAILAPRLDGVFEASDEQIAGAVLMLMERARVVSEGSGAVPVAILDQIKDRIRGKKVVLIVSGGNIDVNLLARIIDRGLILSGRRLRVNVMISDKPGSLARLTALLAAQGANILQAIHDRSEPSTTIDLTEVALTLETRGPDHSAEIIRALRDHVVRFELAQ